jgi:hypothetical protein
MSVKEIISAILSKNASAFEEAFENAMREKVSDAIDSIHEQVDLDGMDEATSREKGDMPVLSKKLSYAVHQNDLKKKKPVSLAKSPWDKNEEVDLEEAEDLDELSRKTLGSYISKASDNVASKGVEIGRRSADADEVDRLTNRNMPNKYQARADMKKALGADDETISKVRRSAGMRLKGIDRAVNRLSK